MPALFRVGLATLALVLSACYPLSSQYPLGNRSDGEDLVRNWQAPDGLRLEFTRLDPERLSLKVFSVKPDAEDEPDAFFFEVLPSVIEGKRYMSVKQIFPDELIQNYARSQKLSIEEARANIARQDERANGYFLAQYRTKESGAMLKLDIYLLDKDNKIIAKSLAKGDLSGSHVQAMKMTGRTEDVLYITNSTEQLTAYLHDNSDRLKGLFDLKITGLVNVH